MFNHHFFGEDMGNYRDFLQEAAKGRLLVTMDPPFGGLLQVLAHTLRRIGEDFISAGTPGMTVEIWTKNYAYCA